MKINKELWKTLTEEDKIVINHYFKTGKLVKEIFELYASKVKIK